MGKGELNSKQVLQAPGPGSQGHPLLGGFSSFPGCPHVYTLWGVPTQNCLPVQALVSGHGPGGLGWDVEVLIKTLKGEDGSRRGSGAPGGDAGSALPNLEVL